MFYGVNKLTNRFFLYARGPQDEPGLDDMHRELTEVGGKTYQLRFVGYHTPKADRPHLEFKIVPYSPPWYKRLASRFSFSRTKSV